MRLPTQPADSDTENLSHETRSSAYAELLSASSLEELEGKPWEVKLALLQHHLELARLFVGELLEEEVEEKEGIPARHFVRMRREMEEPRIPRLILYNLHQAD